MVSPSSCGDAKHLLSPPPVRLVASGIWGAASWKDRRILELGCGVGLTGIVCASLGARAVILTDLEEVVQQITKPNVEENQRILTTVGGRGSPRICAMALSWGDTDNEADVASALDAMAPPLILGVRNNKNGNTNSRNKKASKKKCVNDKDQTFTTSVIPSRKGMPDVLLIGDVAYQHRPGAASHFDVLLSTTLNCTDEQTILVFGTRMRMPASADLLNMLHEHFDEVVFPPIEAHEIDPAFDFKTIGRKHQITIHIMKRKPKPFIPNDCC